MYTVIIVQIKHSNMKPFLKKWIGNSRLKELFFFFFLMSTRRVVNSVAWTRVDVLTTQKTPPNLRGKEREGNFDVQKKKRKLEAEWWLYNNRNFTPVT